MCPRATVRPQLQPRNAEISKSRAARCGGLWPGSSWLSRRARAYPARKTNRIQNTYSARRARRFGQSPATNPATPMPARSDVVTCWVQKSQAGPKRLSRSSDVGMIDGSIAAPPAQASSNIAINSSDRNRNARSTRGPKNTPIPVPRQSDGRDDQPCDEAGGQHRAAGSGLGLFLHLPHQGLALGGIRPRAGGEALEVIRRRGVQGLQSDRYCRRNPSREDQAVDRGRGCVRDAVPVLHSRTHEVGAAARGNS